MERRLTEAEWLVGTAPTIADLALFAYTHRADEGGFDLARWPGVQAWVDRDDGSARNRDPSPGRRPDPVSDIKPDQPFQKEQHRVAFGIGAAVAVTIDSGMR